MMLTLDLHSIEATVLHSSVGHSDMLHAVHFLHTRLTGLLWNDSLKLNTKYTSISQLHEIPNEIPNKCNGSSKCLNYFVRHQLTSGAHVVFHIFIDACAMPFKAALRRTLRSLPQRSAISLKMYVEMSCAKQYECMAAKYCSMNS